MFVVTLLGAPARSQLTPPIAADCAAQLGGDQVDWLGECACQFSAKEISEKFEPLRVQLQAQEIDLCIQKAANRRKEILIADMDSTMIKQECIDELAAEAGVGQQVADITARAMNGELDFDNALRARVQLLAGLRTYVIQDVLKSRITLMPGGPALVATMKANGAYCALVSGGFTDFTSAIAARLGFDEHRANTLLSTDGKLTGQVGEPILGRDAKVQALCEISGGLGLISDDVIAVGDGANDLGMLQLAGTGVALHAKPIVAQQCQIRLDFSDLTGLLYLQGYKSSDFADV